MKRRQGRKETENKGERVEERTQQKNMGVMKMEGERKRK